MFRAIKMYHPYSGGHTSEKVLGVLGIFCFILGAIFCDLSDLFVVFGISAWFYPFMVFLFVKWPFGYLLEKDGILFHCKYKKNKLLYEDIQYIIISNLALSSGRITKTPWVGLIGEPRKELSEYIINGKRRHVLTSEEIKFRLGERIGHYHPGNIWKIFQKGSCTIHNYGFWWNHKEMYKVFEGFTGDYYIAASVLHNYNREFHAIFKRYGIDRQRIHIIDDTINGEFRYNY